MIERFKHYMQKLIKENKIIGASIAVIYEDDIIYEDGFGYARINPKKKMKSDTIMSIQSISKSFAALSIMDLVEDGLIDLDQPLVNYLPYFQTSNKEESDKITVRQILSHTSGLPGDVGIANLVAPNRNEVHGFSDWQKELGITNEVIENIHSFEDITRYFKKVDLAYEPGQKWTYCTDAYSIVGDLFEKVSGLSWFDYIQENIFNKLNMSRTTLDVNKAKHDLNSARYYVLSDSVIKETGFPNNKLAAPAGFIYSTANDLAKYLQANMKNETLFNEMYNPYLNSDGTSPFEDIDKEGYGLGWGISKYKDLKMIHHGGGYPGVRANVSMIPSKKLGVVVLTNYDKSEPKEITNNLLNIFMK